MKKLFVIAEIGINHNGKIKIAKKLIDVAKKGGANAVKFQSYLTEKLVLKKQPLMPYQNKNIYHLYMNIVYCLMDEKYHFSII